MSMSMNINIGEQSVRAVDDPRLDDLEPLVVALCLGAPADGGDISTVSTAEGVAATIGIEHDRVRDGTESAETKANLRDRVAQAVKRFWGADRPCMVERRVKEGW